MTTFATTGFYRVNNVTSLAYGTITQQVVPGATVYVTTTAGNVAATIYSDPLLSAPITNSTVTTDIYGNYSYYIPLNYMVSENISAPGGGTIIIPNVGINGPIVGILTTTASSSDTLSITGIESTSHVSLTATNSSAAAMIASVYVTKSTGSITVFHPSTSGATFDVIVTPY